MKKISSLHFSLIAVSLFIVFAATSLQAKAYGAFDQLQQTAGDSDTAANSYSNGSYDYEDASHNASHNFDTSSDSAPVVDLSGAGEHPTPQLLRGPDDY